MHLELYAKKRISSFLECVFVGGGLGQDDQILVPPERVAPTQTGALAWGGNII